MTVGVCILYSPFTDLFNMFVNIISTRLAMTVGVCILYSPFTDLFNMFVNIISTSAMTVGVCILYSPFTDLFNMFVNIISIRLAMTVGVCTVFTFQRLIQRLFINIISTRLTMTAVRSALYSSLKDLLNICLSPTFVTNISTRLAMTVGICTVFILPKTYSTSVCQHFLHKTYHDCWGLYCIHPFQDVFSICLPPTLPQDLP